MPSETALERQRQINERLEQINATIFGEGSKMSLRYVLFEDVREQDINANVMPVEMFNQLVSNVSKTGALESLPLMATRVETPDVIEVVSGHHRTRAAKQAGLEGATVILYEGLTNAEIRAKQLAHNSIQGKSDPEIVRQIFAQIDSLSEQMESYTDTNQFAEIPVAIPFQMVDIDPLADSKTLTMVFLPTQASDFRTAVDLLTSKPDEVYVAHRACFDEFKKAVQETRKDLDVVSVPTAVAAMARLALERLAQLRQERTEAGEGAAIAVQDASISPEVVAALQ